MKPIQAILKPQQSYTSQTRKQQDLSEPKVDHCVCDGSGWYQVDVDIHHPWFGKIFNCPCQHVRIVREFQRMFGTPLSDVRLSNIVERGPDSKAMKSAALSFVRGEIKFLTVRGNNGTGKTTALMAIVNSILDAGKPALYTTAPEMMSYVKSGIGMDFNDDDRVNKLARIPVLCIDELALVRWTDYVIEKIDSLIDMRYRLKLQTAFAFDNQKVELSERLISRMKSGEYIIMTEPDMRPTVKDTK